jgi:hypothetical protein
MLRRVELMAGEQIVIFGKRGGNVPDMKFLFGQMLDRLRTVGAARVHPSWFHPGQAEIGQSGPFQCKSFLLRPSVITIIFNGLGWPPEILAGQQMMSGQRANVRFASTVRCQLV